MSNIKMKLLYITYIDFGREASSGSSIRPQKMYEAFCRLGVEIKLLECQQNRYSERIAKVKETLKWLEDNTPDICYIESPSGPIFNMIDFKLIKRVHEKKIPIGYFYRDAFWVFKDKMKNIDFFKRRIIILLNKIALKVIKKNVDIVFFVSKSAIDLFAFANFKCTMLLPPAADMNNFSEFNPDKCNYRCIYVGAASEIDGTYDLIKAFNKINQESSQYKLTIVARTAEWHNIQKKIKHAYPWLEVKHVSKDGLIDLYNKSDVAIIPRKKNYYIDISMPVKLFEYIGFGKPVISTPRTETSKFIEQENCGIICEDSWKGLSEAIVQFYSDRELRIELYNNVKKTAMDNRWESRAQKVMDVLTSIYEENI